MVPWLIIIVASLIVILGIVMVVISYKNKGKTKKGPDYYTFLIMGLIWLPIGIIQMITGGSSIFLIIGIVFVGVGLSHKKDWKKNHVSFSQLPESKRKLGIGLIIGLSVLFLLGVIFYFLSSS